MTWAQWIKQPRSWIEGFCALNLAGLAPDILLAHSVNHFGHWGEWIPLVFSIAAAPLLAIAIVYQKRGRDRAWRFLGHAVGACSVAVGVGGMLFHLESQFFQELTIRNLVYTAPFVAPLAYAGIGLLVILNRMEQAASEPWSRWILLLAMGGFAGNFVLTLADHAQNGFYHASEWAPVISSALAFGFLLTAAVAAVDRGFVRWTAGVMILQVAVGIVGFVLHGLADLGGPHDRLLDNLIWGTPLFAPLLFADLAILAMVGLHTLRATVAAE